jgi:hypothetical protein
VPNSGSEYWCGNRSRTVHLKEPEGDGRMKNEVTVRWVSGTVEGL